MVAPSPATPFLAAAVNAVGRAGRIGGAEVEEDVAPGAGEDVMAVDGNAKMPIMN